MHKPQKRSRHDGWTPIRRTEFLGALRVSGSLRDACAWVGMSRAGVYALARRDPGFAALWNAALAARGADRRPPPITPFDMLDGTRMMRRLLALEAARKARPRGIVAQQNWRWG